jgi:hypothetical protein
MSEHEADKIKVGANGPWVHDNEWGVFTTVCGEKFLATCEEWFQQKGVDGVVLTNAISFRIELVQQQGGIVRMPIVGGVDLQTEPATVHARICSAYALQWMNNDDKKQYLSLIHHALRQMAAAKARQSGLVLP